jgi:hypothetical protein
VTAGGEGGGEGERDGAAGSPDDGGRNEPPDGPAPREPRIARSRSSDGADQGPGGANERAEPRPWLERIGLAAIALVMGALLTVMAAASWTGGELILAAMSASGALLTVGVGLMTLIRG